MIKKLVMQLINSTNTHMYPLAANTLYSNAVRNNFIIIIMPGLVEKKILFVYML